MVALGIFSMLRPLSPNLALADEAFCKSIPRHKVHFEYNTAQDGVTLTLTIPAHFRGAVFQNAEVYFGNDEQDFLGFDLGMTRAARGNFTASLELPRAHQLLTFRAIYHGDKCSRVLNAEFKNSQRIN
jgi:hypothetical protein